MIAKCLTFMGHMYIIICSNAIPTVIEIIENKWTLFSKLEAQVLTGTFSGADGVDIIKSLYKLMSCLVVNYCVPQNSLLL